MSNNFLSLDSHLFDIIEPRHPCAGGLTIDDVQRRVAQYVQISLSFNFEKYIPQCYIKLRAFLVDKLPSYI